MKHFRGRVGLPLKYHFLAGQLPRCKQRLIEDGRLEAFKMLIKDKNSIYFEY